jgi:NAD-dependent histone deacetylase SIR2
MAKIAAMAEPTPFHWLIAKLHKRRTLQRVYTQNVDNLELKAGLPCEGVNDPCIQLHGTLMELSCAICSFQQSLYFHIYALQEGTFPKCSNCEAGAKERQEKNRRQVTEGILRPNIVLYGEINPQSEKISEAQMIDLGRIDFLLVVGTSLETYGLLDMIKTFKKKAKQAVYLNKEWPRKKWETVFDIFIEADCQDVAQYCHCLIENEPLVVPRKVSFTAGEMKEWTQNAGNRKDFRPSWNWV